MNTFDPQSNFSEWIQNDWESDDYIEKTYNRSEESKSELKSAGEESSAWAWVLAVLVYFLSNPLFWIILVAVVLIKS